VLKIEFFSDYFAESNPNQTTKRSLSFSQSMENKNDSLSPHQEPNIKQRGDLDILLSFVIRVFDSFFLFISKKFLHASIFLMKQWFLFLWAVARLSPLSLKPSHLQGQKLDVMNSKCTNHLQVMKW